MNEKVIFNYIIFLWILIAFIIVLFLFFKTAPYGKFTRKGWGPQINPKIGWIIMESPTTFLFAYLFFIGSNNTIISIIFFTIWNLHYIYRTLIFPFRIRSKKMMPILIIGTGFFFNIVNCYIQARYLFSLSTPYSINWLSDPRFIFGTILFLSGLIFNIRSDNILISLRKNQTNGYYIPDGGLYKWISCPNYFSEIMEWTGWAILTWSISGLVFVVWSAANLIPRAWSNHKWYKATFPDYPSNRKAVIPYIF